MKIYLIIGLVMVAMAAHAAQPTVGGRTVVLETNGALTNATRVGGTSVAVTNLDLTVSRAMVSSAVGVPTNSVTTAAELAFVNGVTSAIQTQLNAKQASFTTGLGVTNNGGTLSNNITAGSNITLTAGAGGALSIASTASGYTAPQRVILTDQATIATDASLTVTNGGVFQVTLGGNRTLGAPTNPTDGQTAKWVFIQDATGNRTLSLNAVFTFGTDITGITLTTNATKRDFMTAIYDSTSTVWRVVGFVRGY